MQNQIYKGDAINVPAPTGGVVSGNGYLIGSMFGIAAITVAAGVQFALWLVGAFTLVKNQPEAWIVGQIVYWDAVNARATVSNAVTKGATSAATAITSAVLTFSATPAGVAAGMTAYDVTSGVALGTVASSTGTTVTLTANVASAVASGDTIAFSLKPIGVAIAAAANPSASGQVRLNGTFVE